MNELLEWIEQNEYLDRVYDLWLFQQRRVSHVPLGKGVGLVVADLYNTARLDL